MVDRHLGIGEVDERGNADRMVEAACSKVSDHFDQQKQVIFPSITPGPFKPFSPKKDMRRMLRLLAMACLLVAMIALNFSFELLGAPAGAFSQLETANTLNALSYLSAAIAGLILLLFVAFLFPKKAKKMMP